MLRSSSPYARYGLRYTAEDPSLAGGPGWRTTGAAPVPQVGQGVQGVSTVAWGHPTRLRLKLMVASAARIEGGIRAQTEGGIHAQTEESHPHPN